MEEKEERREASRGSHSISSPKLVGLLQKQAERVIWLTETRRTQIWRALVEISANDASAALWGTFASAAWAGITL